MLHEKTNLYIYSHAYISPISNFFWNGKQSQKNKEKTGHVIKKDERCNEDFVAQLSAKQEAILYLGGIIITMCK